MKKPTNQMRFKMAKKQDLQKYTFEFLEYDKNKEVTFATLYRTKPVTKERLAELVADKMKFHKKLKNKFIFSVKDRFGGLVAWRVK
jgi:uncharacterized FlaG/YvyC family protein